MPPDIHSRWVKLKAQLPNVNQLSVPRCVKFNIESKFIQIHGFCDASQRAYGACIYIRTQLDREQFRSELLCSKSRVAPLKAMSLPRLELSAAVLLAHLIEKIKVSIDSTDIQIFLWSDSTIVLNWISLPSRRWSVYVANRVGEIQRLTRATDWRHISSADNPADILSRGINPVDLKNADIWWHGPAFLLKDYKSWPNGLFSISEEGLPELNTRSLALISSEHCVVDELLSKHSNLNKTCRILAYAIRWLKRYRPKESAISVSHAEIEVALNIMCRVVQGASFPEEYRVLAKGDTINSSSSLLPLAPFMHSDGLIRVRERLRNSALSFEERHQILLPRNHVLTKRLVEYTRSAHAGTQATMAAVRQRFWPLSLRSTTRKVVQNCVVCFKVKPCHSEVIMGSLPAGRVTVSRPFCHCGVDYAGPLTLRDSRLRKARNLKAYLSIFVCFATKAVHIELVSDLSSNAFIGALKRFISRRGKPTCMY